MKKPNHKGITSWAYLRFSIIGELLANPPLKGELKIKLKALSEKRYQHPFKEEYLTFSVSTIERWYYQALKANDPVMALSRKIRTDSGKNKSLNPLVLAELKKQYEVYPHWSYQLHTDNLAALVLEKPQLADIPSYSTILRNMKKLGWFKKPLNRNKTKGQIKAINRLESKEIRSFEADHAHALWHLDFHHGKRVVDVKGNWHTPKVLCILDDHSRLCCHIQWYLDETAETLIHGLTQAFYKRGLPRSIMSDNGSAMLAGEVQNGLLRLAIKHEKTLPYSPYQNGKQEAFWGQLEGRLMAMLSNLDNLTLEFLNKATLAWVEQEYNISVHEEISQTPLERMLKAKDVSRDPPDSEAVNFAFIQRETRVLRKSDLTLQIKGVRFEVPSRFRHLNNFRVGFKAWDLSHAYLIDKKTDEQIVKIYPLDKSKNASSLRRIIKAGPDINDTGFKGGDKIESIPPLLRKLLADYAVTGLPPAYIPKEERILDQNH